MADRGSEGPYSNTHQRRRIPSAHTRHARFVLGASLAAVALLLAACGSSGAKSGSTTSSKSTLVFGDLGTDSGPIGAAIADAKLSVEAWAASVNAHGGLAGHKVKVIYKDDGGANPAQALAALNELVNQDHVIALIGFHSLAAPALQSTIDQDQIPVIGTVGGNTLNATDKYFFDPGLSETVGVKHAAVDVVKAAAPDANKLAIFYCLEAPACLQQKTEIAATATASGLDVVYSAQVSLVAPDFTAQIVAARNAGAQVIYMAMDNPSTTRIIQDASQQGWHPVFVGNPTQFVSTFNPSLGNVKFYNYAGTAPWSDSPAMAGYRDAMQTYFPGQQLGNNGSLIWAGLQLLNTIAPQNPTWTPAGIYSALLKLKNVTLGGIVPPITFNNGPHNSVNTCAVPLVWTGSKWAALKTGSDPFVCGPKS